ncbi:hypothetical protein GXW83_27535 [Streptacidiphilus sp. PB12-B1b]|uniref:hypothetical protein n=1 Tax=Streptacidiphilus sp. PB12-B1b TaxID=2705012 RepID=UPI0015FA072E|nr:hypothetical protein [Streptacidiphilus sp. PB12-B1b]QMU78898.1 hypothetical protein GXW83_27535 [Streptacidiphilus sp. PB12-B1b]
MTPADAEAQLTAAMDNYNRVHIEQLQAETGLRHLGDTPAIYLAGHIRIRCPFVGPDGRHYADASLVVESIGGDPDTTRGLLDYYEDIIGNLREGHDLWIVNRIRGEWNGVLAPVKEIAELFQLGPALRMPAGNWARSWRDMPSRTDAEELAWAAAGGKPLAEYRTGERW